MAAKKDWIAGAIKRPGALTAKAERISGGVKGGKITSKGMAKLAASKNPTTQRQVNLARTLKGMSRKRG